jgi:regulator-associated protein of mTOR
VRDGAGPQILNWVDLHNTSLSEFPALAHDSCKESYQRFRHALHFVHLASPSADRLNSLSLQRKETPLGRIVFHSVGYGFPRTARGKMWSWDGRALSPYSVRKVAGAIRTPSWFIFDCDNATAFLPKIEK